MSASGQIVISGSVSGSIPGGDPWNGGTDVMVASFSSDGTPLWTRVFGTAGADFSFNVTTGANSFYVAVDFGPGIGSTIDGAPVIGAAAPTGVVLKIQP